MTDEKRESEPRYCKDCRFYVSRNVSNREVIHRCSKITTTNMVTGEVVESDPYESRRRGECGPEGKLWTPRAKVISAEEKEVEIKEKKG